MRKVPLCFFYITLKSLAVNLDCFWTGSYDSSVWHHQRSQFKSVLLVLSPIFIYLFISDKDDIKLRLSHVAYSQNKQLDLCQYEIVIKNI